MEGLDFFVLNLGKQMLGLLESQVYGSNQYAEYSRDAEGVSLTVELPGASAADIRVYAKKEGVRVVVLGSGERVYSRFFRTANIDSKKAVVTFVNGVLEVRAPLYRGFF
ncbi:MAG: Hsp20/alpha crystallin family protein [Candidatus Altiarchaeota archaeon]|nr:Hsp20/alpha crystallin family protein [Candidatus Altiarchaeota archaeon]